MRSSKQYREKLDLDQKIKELSSSSTIAPQRFLEPELRRLLNTVIVVFPGAAFIDDDFIIYKKYLEANYSCYFTPEAFLPELNEKRTYWWQSVYAGCNAQIEHFLSENKFADALEKLGFGEKIEPVKKIPKLDLNEPIRKYLIGIGYLFPSGEDLLIHPNMLYAQLGHTCYGGDSPFLTRDLIRCPYHWWNELKEEELWRYWKDLACLAFTDFPEYKLYFPDEFRGQKEKDAETQQCLELGRKLVPSRYLELQPIMEQFEWVLDW